MTGDDADAKPAALPEEARIRALKRWIPVVGLLALALAYRIWMIASLQGAPFVAEPVLDSKAYHDWAVEIATESFWGHEVFYQDPLYPYLLGIFYTLFGVHPLAFRILQMLVCVAGLWMLFEAARRAVGHGVAVATLALAALHRTAAFYDVVLLKEGLGPFFVEAAMLCLVLARERRRWWWWVLGGLALGLATLVRGNLILLAPALAGLLLVAKEWRSAGWVLAGAALAILPVTIRNAAVAGEFVVTTAQAGPNLYIGNHEGNWTGRYHVPDWVTASPAFEARDFHRRAAQEAGRPLTAGEASAHWRSRALEDIAAHPGSFLLATVKRALLLVNRLEVPDNYNLPFLSRYSRALWLPAPGFGLVLAPLAAAGLYLTWIERRRFAVVYVLLATALVPIAFFFVFARYRLPALPLLWFLGGYALVKFVELRHWGMKRVTKTAMVVALAMLVVSNIPIERVLDVGRFDFAVQHANLAEWHRARGDKESAVREIENLFGIRPEARDDWRFATLAADVYALAGRRAEELDFRVRAATSSNAPEHWDRAARVYVQYDKWSNAAECWERAGPEYALRAAEAWVFGGFWDKGMKPIVAARRERPNDVEPRLSLARAFQHMWMWKEAMEAAQSVLELDPGHREAWGIVERARERMKK